MCAACGLELFDSKDKYDSGSGWPSFTQPVDAADVSTTTDATHGMERTEVPLRADAMGISATSSPTAPGRGDFVIALMEWL